MSVPGIPELLFSHWQAAPSLDGEAVVGAGLYLFATTRVSGRWPVRRTAAFLGGIAATLVALQSGLGAYDDVLLSVHMVQHLILLLVAPLLLLWGRPAMLALRALPRGGRRRLARLMARLRWLGHWSIGLGAFYVVVIGPHFPAFYDATLRHPVLHEAEHLTFLIGGLLYLWPLFGSPAGARPLGSVGSLCYVIAAMPACAIVGAWLNEDLQVAYAPYRSIDHALGVSAVTDQRIAGAIMWIGAHLILTGLALWVLASKLVGEERRQRVRDALQSRPGVPPAGEEESIAA